VRVSEIGIYTTALGFLVFLVFWALRKPWKTSDAGLYFWTVTCVLTVIFLVGAVLITVPITDPLVVAWLSAVLYVILSVAIWVLVIHAVIARRRK
jgi:hypothetical protein